VSARHLKYATWEELFGTRPTHEQLLREILMLDAGTVIPTLAWIDLLLVLDRFHSEDKQTHELQTYLVNRFVDNDLFARLQTAYGHEQLVLRRPFHSRQVLTLMKNILAETSNIGRPQPSIDSESAFRLGRCLIMTNDFLVTPQNISAISPNRPPSERKIALQLQVGSGLEINNPPPIHTSIVRSDMIFGNLASASPGSLDPRNAFHRERGMTIEEYVDHLLAVLTYYITLDFRKLIDDPGLACVDTNVFFSHGPREASEGFWRIERTTVEALQSSIRAHTGLTAHQDFIAFREKPFLETTNGNVIPLHLGFVQEQLESGLFWTIVNSIEAEKDRHRLFTDWGHLFEEYVSQIISECLRGTAERYLSFARFSDKSEEAFDGIVSASDCLVVMEYKGGFLSANAKYAENENEFIRDLDRKFGREKGAGIEQLFRKLAALFAEVPERRRHIDGLDTSNTEIVIPVLIVQDSFVSSELTASYLADVFASLLNRERIDPKVACTFPLVLDVSDLEALRPFLAAGEISFCDVLRDRVRLGSGVLPFRDFFQFYRTSRNVRWVPDDDTMRRFTEIMDRLSIRFFKKPLEAV